jgi:hypothetical protein
VATHSAANSFKNVSFNGTALCIFRAIWRKTNKHIFKDKSSTSTTEEVAETLKNNLKEWKTADLRGIATVIIYTVP